MDRKVASADDAVLRRQPPTARRKGREGRSGREVRTAVLGRQPPTARAVAPLRGEEGGAHELATEA